MATGTNTYESLAVPLLGESEIIQQTAATDILTITGADTQTGDFIALRDSTKTNHFQVRADGNVVITQKAAGTVGFKILQASAATAKAIQVTTNDGTTEQFSVGPDGNPVITQVAAATVGLKITRASLPTSSAIQVTDNGGTAQWSVTKNWAMLWKVRTTRPTTGLTKGEMMLLFHGSTPKIGVCTSTAANTIKLIRLKTKTFGRLTA